MPDPTSDDEPVPEPTPVPPLEEAPSSTGVEIPDEELVPDNFESIAAIGRLVEGKDGAGT